jgi:hypothetical protein
VKKNKNKTPESRLTQRRVIFIGLYITIEKKCLA